MPSKHTIKIYAGDMYYHAYNRGVNKAKIFRDTQDYETFLNLFKRYLDDQPVRDNKGREYDWLHNDIKLLAYCLMPNHFHLLVFQYEPTAVTRLIRAVCTAYTTYFNKKYGRVGHLFQGVFKASPIQNDAYLEHISRYIHLNPKDFEQYEFSSIGYYLGNKQAGWIDPTFVLDVFNHDRKAYLAFLKEYEGYKKSVELAGAQLADATEIN